MKKLISIIMMLSISASLFCQAVAAQETAPPAEGMRLWLEAGEGVEITSKRISRWADQSAAGGDLVKFGTGPSFKDLGTKLKEKSAVAFSRNTALVSENPVDYQGDASFLVYFRQSNDSVAQTLFSSHSYVGSAVTESGKIPFSIASTAAGDLIFRMASADGAENLEYPMNVSILRDENGEFNYMGLYVTIDAKSKTVTVYSKKMGEQTEITEPAAQFSITEAPYWESYAYGLRYDGSRQDGVQAEIAETIIYDRVLPMDEINAVNRYLKVKYEYPVIERLKLENEVMEIKKGEVVALTVIGIGNLMGETVEMPLKEGVTVTSGDSNVIMAINGALKAIHFGSAQITISYAGVELSFVVDVPQVSIHPAEIGSFAPGAEVQCRQTIENFETSSAIPIVMAAALYRNDLLLDVQFERADISDTFTFDMRFTLPEDIAGCSIHMMVLDANTMTPLSDCTVRKQGAVKEV